MNAANTSSDSRLFRTVVTSWLAATVLGVMLWGFWVSFDLPFPFVRPHLMLWDVLVQDYQSRGIEVGPPGFATADEPLLRYTAWLVRRTGWGATALTAAQLPFLAALLLGVALAAWRVAGPRAGALAPWVAAFAPMTVGLSLHVDEFLMLQAMVALALAAVFWADSPRRRALAFLAVPPLAAAMKLSLLKTNAIWALGVFGATAFTWVGWQWAAYARAKNRPGWRQSPLLPTVAVAAAAATTLAMLAPLDFDYYRVESTLAQSAGTVWNTPRLLWVVPYVEAFFHLGFVLAGALAAALVVLVWRGPRAQALPTVAWLLSAAAVSMWMTKRNDYYSATAVPAAYVLVAAGIARVTAARHWRYLALGVVGGLAVAWLALVQHTPLYYARQAQEVGRFYDGDPAPYLISPFPTARDERHLAGRFAARICGRAGQPVVFICETGIDGGVALYAWQVDPSVPMQGLRDGPLTQPDNSCVLAQTDRGRWDPAPALADVVRKYRESVSALGMLSRPGVEWRLYRMSVAAPEYEPAATFGQWVLYRPKRR